jgi:hypothetical protein
MASGSRMIEISRGSKPAAWQARATRCEADGAVHGSSLSAAIGTFSSFASG